MLTHVTSLPQVDNLHQSRLEVIIKVAPGGWEGVYEGSVDALRYCIWVSLQKNIGTVGASCILAQQFGVYTTQHSTANFGVMFLQH